MVLYLIHIEVFDEKTLYKIRFRLIKPVLIAFLSFSESLATECVSLNNKPCMLRPIPFNYYSFMISLDKCNGSCNAVDYLSMKICVPSKMK